MTKGKKALNTVAIIPARGGSKRLPGKNTKLLGGKPLIEWTLEAAKGSRVVDLMVVTSDDEEALAIGRDHGAMVVRRPASLASDTATSVDVISHAIRCLADEGVVCEQVMLLQPTSPLRRAEHIQAAVTRMRDKGAASVISVCEADHSPLLTNTLPPSGCMRGFIRDDVRGVRSQDLPTYYRLNGAIYLVKTDVFLRNHILDALPCYALVMERSASVDIDELNDFRLAEIMLSDDSARDC